MILVTGGTGFLGSELISQLINEGSAVRAIKRAGSEIPAILHSKPVQWVQADVLNYFELEEAFEGIAEVYHCAALVSFNPSDKKNLLQVNVQGTAHIVNLCLQHDIKKLLYVSSVAAIGDAKPGKEITENDFWEFNGRQYGYSISKYEAEMEVWRGIAEGLRAVIVNPSIIIGKNAGSKGSGKLFERVREGLSFYPGGSAGLVDVEDVAKLMIKLMKNGPLAQRFIINAESLSFREIFKRAAEAYGTRPPFIRLQPWMMQLAWRVLSTFSLFTGKHHDITKETVYSAFKKREYSGRKIQELFRDFEFKKVSESINEICKTTK